MSKKVHVEPYKGDDDSALNSARGSKADRLGRLRSIAEEQDQAVSDAAADVQLEREAMVFLWNLVLYLLFLMLFVILTLGPRTDTTPYRIRNQHLMQLNEWEDPDTTVTQDLFAEKLSDVWEYLEGHFLWVVMPPSQDPTSPDIDLFPLPGYVQGVAKRFGTVRLRTVRVKENTCNLEEPVTKDAIPKCYPPYKWGDATEDKTCINDVPGPSGTCKYKYTEQVSPTRDDSWSSQRLGWRQKYPGNGGFHIDLTSNKDAQEKMAAAKAADWINWATRAVFAEYTLYFPASNHFLAVRIIWEMPADGGIIATSEAEIIPADGLESLSAGQAVCEVLFLILLVYYILVEVKELFSSGLVAYFSDAWNILDMVNFFCFILVIFFRFWAHDLRNQLDLSNNLAKTDATAADIGFQNVHYVAYYTAVAGYANSFNGFLTWFKLFKYLKEIGYFSLLINLLYKAVINLVMFMCSFLIVNVGFMHSFCLAFGLHIDDYRDPSITLLTLIRLAMGDFDYHALYRTNRTLAPLLFLIYVLLNFFILVNVFITIISDAFEEAKTMNGETMVVRYFKLQLKKRTSQKTKRIERIRAQVLKESKGEDDVLDASEIKEIESMLTKSELQDWRKLMSTVDVDGDGQLKKEEVNVLLKMMSQDVEQIMQKEQEQLAMLDRPALSPEHREVIAVRNRLGTMEESYAQMSEKIDLLLSKSGAA